MAPRILDIDLTARSARSRPCDPELAAETLGGVALATALLEERLRGRVDPLGPDNVVVFAAGPFAATPVPAATKHAVATISPLTGRLTDGLASSHWSAALRRAGYAAVVLSGRADAWTTLAVDADGARFLDAAPLLGTSAAGAAEHVRGTLGPRWRTAAIGPAGERLVRFATIENDGRQAGRGGAGAVLGAKRVKAIAVHDVGPVFVADPPRARALSSALRQRALGPATAKYRMLGTGANLRVLARMGMLPAFNFRQATFAGSEAVTPERAREDPGAYRAVRGGCVNCPVQCEHMYVRAGSGGRAAPSEYESVWAFGPNCGVEDLDAVLAAISACDRLGLDTISAGGVLAFAMDCASLGVFPSDAFGPPLEFGNGRALVAALEAIARGDTPASRALGLGVRAAAAAFGGSASALAVHVKGLELPGYEPRALPTYALGLAVCTRGACHNRAATYDVDLRDPGNTLDDEARARAVVDAEDEAILWDTLVLCKFVRGCFDDFPNEAAELVRAATGIAVDGPGLRARARRTWARKRRINVSQGWTPAEDALPPRLAEALPSGPYAGAAVDPAGLERQRVRYESLRAARLAEPVGAGA